jgi:hypothetical protein
MGVDTGNCGRTKRNSRSRIPRIKVDAAVIAKTY